MDSIYVFCKYPELLTAIGKENKKETAEYLKNEMAIIRKRSRDTIFMDDTTRFSDKDPWGFGYEATRLFREKKVMVVYKKNKRQVETIKKRKDGKRGQVLYYTYYDADTKNELFHEMIRSWQKF